MALTERAFTEALALIRRDNVLPALRAHLHHPANWPAAAATSMRLASGIQAIHCRSARQEPLTPLVANHRADLNHRHCGLGLRLAVAADLSDLAIR